MTTNLKDNNAVEKKEPQKTLRDILTGDQMKKQFALALPKHLSPDRFVRIALTALTKTPKLQQCTQSSFFACLLDLSQLGLEPDGRKAHLIPYGEQCQLLVDYKGLVELARRSGQVSDIHADVVCEGDFFDYSFGSEGKLIHKPTLKERGKVTAAYSFVKLKDGSVSFEVMSVDEIMAIKKRSKAGNAGPWITDWNEMAKKTVFRRHSKWLPLSSEFQEAIEKDFDVPDDILKTDVPSIEMSMPKPKAPVLVPGTEAVKEASANLPEGWEAQEATENGICRSKNCTEEIKAGAIIAISTSTKEKRHLACVE